MTEEFHQCGKADPSAEHFSRVGVATIPGRNSRHYAGFRTIPGELKLGLIGGSLASIFPA
jgi:hypothetical protein